MLSTDEKFMQLALDAAETVLGKTTPNPAVGCVIVQQDKVIGTGATSKAGGSHAEVHALAQASDKTKGATAYVTLEPCSHYGRTPPCVDALIKSGVSRVVIACADPDPRVSGKGIEKLKISNIQVEVGCKAKEAIRLNRGFLSRVVRQRPWVTLKIATSLDGKIACSNGHSQWITNCRAREAGHQLRAINDAILVGCGTIIDDDPQLTVRLPDQPERSIWRIILEGKRPCPPNAKVLTDQHRNSTLILSTLKTGEQSHQRVNCKTTADGQQIDLHDAMNRLTAYNINAIMVEGGSYTACQLLKEGLVDELHLFRAPIIIGGDGVSVISSLGLQRVDDSVKLHQLQSQALGDNQHESYLTDSGASFMGQLHNTLATPS
ncbi:bifunctional diaminohydroxyphosphoribosylaminopyrimidine deaminase/5-amino-6-(5-phosphoribosylamino)uracil reductase RibD [Alteromonadaceae bacterium M269]|nr:bifunctional diaminohydroxyphosphoribosylaminopyrimidine deaminase/5-amino-6-(5-phosphoribosylamino)uracil reductase RibD [Alteromonadaceae bacterium M269]